MNADERRSDLDEITHQIIGCAMKVHNTLGCGFLEKVYENALTHELRKTGFAVEQQLSIAVLYDGVVVGDYVVDIMVNGKVVVELKVVNRFDEIHSAQCLNYLKATNMKICLLFNFAKPRLDWKRFVNEF